jgi:hypothetical protein
LREQRDHLEEEESTGLCFIFILFIVLGSSRPATGESQQQQPRVVSAHTKTE